MLKKSAALITCVMLVLTLLAGCSGDTNSASGTAAGSSRVGSRSAGGFGNM